MHVFDDSVRIALPLALLFTMSCATLAGDDEGKATRLKESDVPQKVMDTIKSSFAGAKIDSIERETEDGKVIYDFEMTQDGAKAEADVQDDGTLLETERAIKLADAPAAITQAVKEKFPNGEVKEVMAKTKGGATAVHEYEVVVKDGGKSKEVTIAPDGKITQDAGGEDEKGKEKEEKEQ
jgi:uncharacterized membrane protein YkoI